MKLSMHTAIGIDEENNSANNEDIMKSSVHTAIGIDEEVSPKNGDIMQLSTHTAIGFDENDKGLTLRLWIKFKF